jgi:putative transposase
MGRRWQSSGAAHYQWLLHHSDRGSQCAGHALQDNLLEYSVKYSMSREGNRWENALAECAFNDLKNEQVHGRWYATRDEARAVSLDCIEPFYNRSRRNSPLLRKTPA